MSLEVYALCLVNVLLKLARVRESARYIFNKAATVKTVLLFVLKIILKKI